MSIPFTTKVATTLRTEGRKTICQYYKTDVIAFEQVETSSDYPIYEVTLNTGGHFTKTTKKRINEVANSFALGFTVTQHEGMWVVANTREQWHGRTITSFGPEGSGASQESDSVTFRIMG